MSKIKNFVSAFFLMCLLQFSSSFAANKVYILKSCANYNLLANEERCIVADSDKWECRETNSKMISGNCKIFPMDFAFHIDSLRNPINNTFLGFNDTSVMLFATQYLHKHSKIHSTVFGNVHIREKVDAYPDIYYVVEGCYFDNNYSGYFALYLQQVPGGYPREICYTMLVKLKILGSSAPDDEAREHLFQEAFHLIHPLYS